MAPKPDPLISVLDEAALKDTTRRWLTGASPLYLGLGPEFVRDATGGSISLEAELAQLSEEQFEVWKMVVAGRNVFLTGNDFNVGFWIPGSAGTGKTRVINAIMRTLSSRKRMALTASTGLAATHKVRSQIPKDLKHLLRGITQQSKTTDVNVNSLHDLCRTYGFEDIAGHILRFDPGDFVGWTKTLERILKGIRARRYLPMGGMQVMLSGDFLQYKTVQFDAPNVSLDTIRCFGKCLAYGEAKMMNGVLVEDTSLHSLTVKFAFQSEAWKELNLATGILRRVFRQADQVFQGVLADVRMGKCTPAAKELINGCLERKFPADIQPVKMYPTNALVTDENSRRFNEIHEDIEVYVAYNGIEPLVPTVPEHAINASRDTVKTNADLATPRDSDESDESDEEPTASPENPFKPNGNSSSTDPNRRGGNPDLTKMTDKQRREIMKILDESLQATQEVELKVGCQVMLLVNLSTEAKLVNGSLGVVIGFQKIIDGEGDSRKSLPTEYQQECEWLEKHTELHKYFDLSSFSEDELEQLDESDVGREKGQPDSESMQPAVTKGGRSEAVETKTASPEDVVQPDSESMQPAVTKSGDSKAVETKTTSQVDVVQPDSESTQPAATKGENSEAAETKTASQKVVVQPDSQSTQLAVTKSGDLKVVETKTASAEDVPTETGLSDIPTLSIKDSVGTGDSNVDTRCESQNKIQEQDPNNCKEFQDQAPTQSSTVVTEKPKPTKPITVSKHGPSRRRLYPVVRFNNGQTLLIVPCKLDVNVADYVAYRWQIPLKLAWALTIHKSQGMSIDFASIDLSTCFVAGQAYTAMSRARTREGLHILRFKDTGIRADPLVLHFYQQLEASQLRSPTSAATSSAAPFTLERSESQSSGVSDLSSPYERHQQSRVELCRINQNAQAKIQEAIGNHYVSERTTQERTQERTIRHSRNSCTSQDSPCKSLISPQGSFNVANGNSMRTMMTPSPAASQTDGITALKEQVFGDLGCAQLSLEGWRFLGAVVQEVLKHELQAASSSDSRSFTGASMRPGPPVIGTQSGNKFSRHMSALSLIPTSGSFSVPMTNQREQQQYHHQQYT
ncbi:hypothetical protein HK102_003165, partial [Quaeritorhiza haematococci]